MKSLQKIDFQAMVLPAAIIANRNSLMPVRTIRILSEKSRQDMIRSHHPAHSASAKRH